MTAAITAWAWRTALGDTVEAAVSRLIAGERAATRGGAGTPWRCSVAAPIPGAPRAAKHRRFLPRMAQLGLECALEAVEASGTARGERLGVFAAVGGLRVSWDDTLPALRDQRDDGAQCWERGLRALHPFWLLRHLSNNAHALVAAELDARGEGVTFGGANAGAQALAAAAAAIEAGALDAAVVLAYDSLLEPEALLDLASRGALAEWSLDRVQAPYTPGAAGRVPGEAAAALVLEGANSPRALVRIEAAHAADGGDAEPAASTLARALARIARGGESLIDGAAFADPALDGAERAALAGVAGEGALLTATAGAFGHTGAAAALVQAIALGECLRRAVAPPIPHMTDAGSDHPLQPLATARRIEGSAALAVCGGAPGLAGALRLEVP